MKCVPSLFEIDSWAVAVAASAAVVGAEVEDVVGVHVAEAAAAAAVAAHQEKRLVQRCRPKQWMRQQEIAPQVADAVDVGTEVEVEGFVAVADVVDAVGVEVGVDALVVVVAAAVAFVAALQVLL